MVRIAELDTPTMVVDLDVMEDNVQRLQRELDTLRLRSRPHIKTHKIPAVAHQQLAAGAIGITDILIACNIVGPPKLERLVRLARRVTTTVALDSAATARGIAEACRAAGTTVQILIEFDSGLRRAGVQSAREAQALARTIAGLPGLAFQGFMCYPSTASTTATSTTCTGTCPGA